MSRLMQERKSPKEMGLPGVEAVAMPQMLQAKQTYELPDKAK
jgi:hypothetical protein